MRVSRSVALCCCVAAVTACAKSEDRAASDSATAPANATPPNAAPAAISLADVAGKWQVRSKPESGTDTTTTQYVLTAAADSSGWTITYPNRKPIPIHVTTSGDSIMTSAGPYESFRRKGLQVTTQGVMRRQNDRLVGSTIAHYKTKGADSVMHLRTEATRLP